MAPSIRPTSTPSSASSAGVPNILLVNVRVPREWEAEVNSELNAAVARHPGVKLVDWFGYSAPHGDWFESDHTHLKGGRAWRPSPTSFSGDPAATSAPHHHDDGPVSPITTVSGPSFDG